MVITRIIDFPDAKAKAICIVDGNGDYNIYLNARISIEEQIKGLLHELKHVSRNDFEKADVQSIELEVRQ